MQKRKGRATWALLGTNTAKPIACLAFGLFLLQQSALTASAQVVVTSNAPDPRVEELLRKLQQLTAPQRPQGTRAQRIALKTHIKAKFNIIEKSQTLCKRNAFVSFQVFDVNNQFHSGTSIKEMTCAQGKCTATVHMYVNVADADPNVDINVFPSVVAKCLLKQSGNNFELINDRSQTAAYPGQQVSPGGTKTVNVKGHI